MEWLTLGISALLLLATARTVAGRLGRDSKERFWFRVGTAALSIGVCVTILSIAQALRTVPFLIAQAMLLAAVFFLPRVRHIQARQRREKLPRFVIAAIAGLIILTGIEQLFL